MLLCKLGPTAPCQMTLKSGKTVVFLGYVQECTKETKKQPQDVLALFVSLNEQGLCSIFLLLLSLKLM